MHATIPGVRCKTLSDLKVYWIAVTSFVHWIPQQSAVVGPAAHRGPRPVPTAIGNFHANCAELLTSDSKEQVGLSTITGDRLG